MIAREKEDLSKKTLFSTRDVAQLLSVDDGTVVDWEQQGKLSAYRTPGGHRRIQKSDLLAFLRTYKIPIPSELVDLQRTVLLVDDETPVRRYLKRLFEITWPELRVEEAADGYDAGRMVERYKPDLVVLDLFLPGIDGFQVCKSIRKDSQLAHTRVLAITGHHSEETRKRIMAAGADAYLTKPFRSEALQSRVETLLPHLGKKR